MALFHVPCLNNVVVNASITGEKGREEGQVNHYIAELKRKDKPARLFFLLPSFANTLEYLQILLLY